MKVLLIEDNLRLAERIKHYLGKSFIVDIAPTGEEGMTKALANTYAIILLDLNLPDIHGGEVCRTLRKAQLSVPILVLSGIKGANSRISLLNDGADDYLVKPFEPDELVARMRALSRRYRQGYNQHILMIDDLKIDVNRRYVERGGKSIALRRKEFDILEYLVSNRGRAVTREMILNHAWDGEKESWANTINVHIKYLRDKVDKPFSLPLIKTAYGVGYMVDDMT